MGGRGAGGNSEAWGPPQFQEKLSRSEKAILGALGAFRGILGAALGAEKVILGMQNPILGMASHDLCNAKTTILGATPGAYAHAFSERFFKNWGGPCAPEQYIQECALKGHEEDASLRAENQVPG